jgi:hypothetical protein
MSIDLNGGFEELRYHVGHEIECVIYGGDANVAVECVTCGSVLIDFDNPAWEDD